MTQIATVRQLRGEKEELPQTKFAKEVAKNQLTEQEYGN